jgi:hypothetical protein
VGTHIPLKQPMPVPLCTQPLHEFQRRQDQSIHSWASGPGQGQNASLEAMAQRLPKRRIWSLKANKCQSKWLPSSPRPFAIWLCYSFHGGVDPLPLPLNLARLEVCFNPKNAVEGMLCQFWPCLKKAWQLRFHTPGILSPPCCGEQGLACWMATRCSSQEPAPSTGM